MSNRGPTNQTVTKRVNLVSKILERMKTNDIKPANLTAISVYVADTLSDQEGKPCNGSTLRRRKGPYRRYLDDFMTEMGYGGHTNIIHGSPLELQLQIRELTQMNQALEKQLADAYQTNDLLTHKISSSVIETIDQEPLPPLDEEIYFKILFNLITDIGYQVDTYNNKVFDDLTHTTIFTAEEIPCFFNWYQETTQS